MEDKNKLPDIDPKKLFDEKNYSTIVIKNNDADEPSLKRKKTKTDLSQTIMKMLDSDKTELLKALKDVNAQDTIAELIKKTENTDQLPKLVALCWESGLDFSKHTSLFFNLVVNPDIFVSLEALTVLENIEKFNSVEELEQGITVLKLAVQSNHPNKGMIEESRLQLFEKLKSMKEKS